MFALIESKLEIKKVQRMLEASVRRDFKVKGKRNIGYPGGKTNNAEVISNGRYWYWSKDHNPDGAPNPKRLNWFGLFQDDGDLQISVEINTPFEGVNGNASGFFARDNQTGLIYLFHSARLGGGTTGVHRNAFLTWSGQRLEQVFDSTGKVRNGVLVMPVEGMASTVSAIRYVEKIAGFKRAVRAGETSSQNFKNRETQLVAYYAEARGRRKGKRSADFDYVSRHGEVVEALHEWRKSNGLVESNKLTKNILIDLGVSEGSSLREVYEVKTSAARQNVYTAIGQLIVHGSSDDCKRYIVLPHGDALPSDIKRALSKNGIEVVLFKLTEHTAVIL